MTRRCRAILTASAASTWCAALFLIAGPPAAAQPPAIVGASTWQPAIKVPGTAFLNAGGNAGVNSVSCASPGNCAAGGVYADAARHGQAFVANEVNGTWEKAQEVPGTATLNALGVAGLSSVSCTSAGNCSAGGFYKDAAGQFQAFVVTETSRTWHAAMQVPGLAALEAGGRSTVIAVSCTSKGNCAAAGNYVTGSLTGGGGYVVSEVNGRWHDARAVQGPSGHGSNITSLSCGATGDCAIGGSYSTSPGHGTAFVDRESGGTWHGDIQVPGLATLNTGDVAEVFSLSCPSAGTCLAGGTYQPSADHQDVFVVSEVKGAWQRAEEALGTATLNKGADDDITSVSCATAGNCALGGFIENGGAFGQAFVASQSNGTWHNAREVPGIALLDNGQGSGIGSVSCGSPGNCSAGGQYVRAVNGDEAFVVNEVNGTWRAAAEVPGTDALNKGGDAAVNSVSCVSAGSCAAGGYYRGSAGLAQAFVANRR